MVRSKSDGSDSVGISTSSAALLSAINKKLGFEALNFASHPKFKIERIPTNIPAIDDLLSGGFARGRYFEIFGDFSLGKTTICLYLVAAAQNMGLDCFWLDPERSFSNEWASHCGVDTDSLLLVQELDFGDQYFDVAQALLRGSEFGVGICDSIAALYPQQEDDKPTSSLMPGTQARLMSKGLRKLTASNKKTALGFINQTRQKIGVMYGDPTTTSGGKAMAFYAGSRLHLRYSEQIKEKLQVYDDKSGAYKGKDVKVGVRVSVIVEKDKTGGAHREDTASFIFRHDWQRFDEGDMLFNLGRKHGLIKKNGNNYRFSKWTVLGKDNFQEMIRETPVLRRKLTVAVTARISERPQDEDTEGVTEKPSDPKRRIKKHKREVK